MFLQHAGGPVAPVLLVAPVDGPAFMMDTVTGEMEPVEDIAPATEIATKLDIALELDMNDVSQDEILAMIASDEEPAKTITPAKLWTLWTASSSSLAITTWFSHLKITHKNRAYEYKTPQKPVKLYT